MPWVREPLERSGLKGRQSLGRIEVELTPPRFSRPFRLLVLESRNPPY